MNGLRVIAGEAAPDPVEEQPRRRRSLVWQDDAHCLGLDPDIFFPEQGESAEDARAVCADCPVIDECLDYAIDTNQELGIWGGTNGRERRRIAAARRSARRAREIDSLPPLRAAPSLISPPADQEIQP